MFYCNNHPQDLITNVCYSDQNNPNTICPKCIQSHLK